MGTSRELVHCTHFSIHLIGLINLVHISSMSPSIMSCLLVWTQRTQCVYHVAGFHIGTHQPSLIRRPAVSLLTGKLPPWKSITNWSPTFRTYMYVLHWRFGQECQQVTNMGYKAKINNMLVSGNMTPQKMGRKVGKIFYFKKKFCPIFYFMTHLFPTAQLKNRGVEAPRP